MAFNPERLSLVVEPIGGVGLRWFNYQTDESEDDLIAADYLPDAEKYGLRAYDLIFVSPASGTEEPYILTVDAIDADGNATLVNSARFGSDTLSYPDKAAVGRIRIPAATDNILVSAYDATVDPSAGRANYRAASDADYAATPALLRLTDAAGRKFIINETQINVLMAGADPTGVADSAAAFKAVRDLFQTGSAYRGGIIFVPPGIYKINETIEFTKYSGDPVHNTRLVGAGVLATTLDFSGAPAGSDGLRWGPGSHFGASDFMISGAPRHGLVIGDSSGEYAARFNFHDIRIQNCGGDGLYSKNAFTGAFRNMWIRENAGYGVNFDGFHTSITAEAVAALSNDLAGFHLDQMCYSSFVSCASDQNEYGYSLSNLNAVSFVACGTESNNKDGWLLRASDALSSGVLTAVQNIKGVSFLNCFNFANGKAASGTYATFINALTANSRPIEISIDGCTSWRNHSSDNSIIANGASGTIKINERMSSYDGSVSASGTYRWIGRRFSLTPTIYGTTSAGTGTYTNQSGSYQFISDDEIVFDLRVDWSAHTGTGNLTVATGLPFNAVGNYPVTIYYSSLDYVVAPSMGIIQNNSKDIILVYPADNAGNTLTPIDGAAQVIISGRYRIAA